jgi:glucose-6-phosphate isomerase
MKRSIYEEPLKIELVDGVIFVNGTQHPRDIRTYEQMKDVVKEEFSEKGELYYMYRDIYKKNDIRFDITVIPQKQLGNECSKTHGHYHPKNDEGVEYAEIYQVLQGNAMFILQKRNSNDTVEVIIVDAEEKDIVLIPPGYGHVSINKSDETLVLSNLVYDKFTSIYGDYKTNRGAAYYYVTAREIEQNTNYLVNKNERFSPEQINKKFGLEFKDLLSEFAADPDKFEFLKKPEML